MTTAALPLEELGRRCAEETQRYGRREANDPRFCFELLRRALADGLADAFTWVYRVYERQVLRWVYQHRGFAQTGETAEYFANAALNRFYFALRGPKFSQFQSLPQLLTYLKACVHTAVAQYLRDQQKAATLPLDEAKDAADAPDLSADLDAAELWDYICRLLPDARDQWLARCVFVLGMKPSTIVAANPTHWHTEREVSLALYRIRRLLRADPELRQRLGVAEPAEAGS